MSVQYRSSEHNAVYGPLSLDIQEENAGKPKERIVLFVSAFGGKHVY